MGFVASMAELIGLYMENLTVLLIFCALSGFFLYPVMPAIIELACELSFPIGEVNIIKNKLF